MDTNQLINHVQWAIDQGEKEKSKLPAEVLRENLPGLSSNKVRHFLNNLCSTPQIKHLEIGTHTGSTLIAAGYDNSLDMILHIDDFSMKPDDRSTLFDNLVKYKDHLPDHHLIECDCWRLDTKGLAGFNTYFYDAFHSQTAQRKAITEYWDCLAKQAVIIIDDYDVKRVNRGTQDGFNELKVKNKIVKSWHLRGGNVKTRVNLWWGGLGVFVIDKEEGRP